MNCCWRLERTYELWILLDKLLEQDYALLKWRLVQQSLVSVRHSHPADAPILNLGRAHSHVARVALGVLEAQSESALGNLARREKTCNVANGVVEINAASAPQRESARARAAIATQPVDQPSENSRRRREPEVVKVDVHVD